MADTHATAAYAFSLERQFELAAGKNFLTLFNPTSSTRPITLTAFFASSLAEVSGVTYPLRGYRISAEPTGGTLHGVDEICKFDTALKNPVLVVRSGNPSCTPQAALFSSPVAQQPHDFTSVHEIDAPPGFNPFLIRPGEGLVFRQGFGVTSNMWNISAIWRELRGT